jgi:hypothetical protein
MEQTSILKTRENYFQVFGMILGLIVILPFVFIYRAIEFLRE